MTVWFSHPNVFRPEQKLTIQVGPFYKVHVCYSDVTLLSCTEPNQGKVFQKLAANGASSNLKIQRDKVSALDLVYMS